MAKSFAFSECLSASRRPRLSAADAEALIHPLVRGGKAN
jgi:hypothetical protein